MPSQPQTQCAPSRLFTPQIAAGLLGGLILHAGRAHAQCASPDIGLMRLASVSATGAPGSLASYVPQVSDDGRYVGFLSQAQNFTTPPQSPLNFSEDLFVKDVWTGELVQCNVKSTGQASTSSVYDFFLQGNGRGIAFHTNDSLVPEDSNTFTDVYYRDLDAQTTEVITLAHTGATAVGGVLADISANGRYVLFASGSPNLVLGDLNSATDFFVRDRQLGVNELVSLTAAGTLSYGGVSPDAGVSDDGRFIAYITAASDIVPGDTNNVRDIFLRDRLLGTTTLATVAPDGSFANGATPQVRLSGSGRWLAFQSYATNLTPDPVLGFQSMIFLRDNLLGVTRLVSKSIDGSPAADCGVPRISGDGRFVAFASEGENFVPVPTGFFSDGYIYDVERDEICWVTRNAGNGPLNALAGVHSISHDGRFLAVGTAANNNVSPDGPGHPTLDDAFVLDRSNPGPYYYCTRAQIPLGCAAALDVQGLPQASASTGFQISSSELPNDSRCGLLYSLTGSQEQPFGVGTLCLRPPLSRAGFTSSAGTLGVVDCSGSFKFDFNSYMAAGTDPALLPGTWVWAQIWYRDPQHQGARRHATTGAVSFVIRP